MKKQADEQIIHILEQHPQQGMELLIETYTGLIWKVISFHLRNPEDIKECVNDTFAQFYFHRNSFDANKSSLAVYLTAIARHLAISRYRKEKKHSSDSSLTELPIEDSSLHLTESNADLCRALKTLKPNELQIIQMKYYEGMTISEIADSLNLPYETVKKRHQRSIHKLKHILLYVLLFLLLMAFTACTYKVLRHYNLIPSLFPMWETDTSQDDQSHLPSELPDDDQPFKKTLLSDKDDKNSEKSTEKISSVKLSEPETSVNTTAQNTDSEDDYSHISNNYTYIPGYGVKNSSNSPSYTLSSVVSAEDDATKISVTSASLIGKKLKITIAAESKTKPFSVEPEELDQNLGQDLMRFADKSTHILYYHDTTILCATSCVHDMENRYREIESYEKEDFEIWESDKDQIPFTVHCYDLDLSFSLTPATEEKITDNNIYQMKEYGGLLIVPRLEDGSLKIAIHPLNQGELITLPGLIRGPIGEMHDDGVITATDQDGNTLTGTCIRYYPGSTSNYFEWDFGKASPGSYSLHIPFLFQIPTIGEEFSIPVNFTDQSWETKKYDVTGGKIWVSDITDPYELPKDDNRYVRYEDAIKYWGTIDYPNSFVDNPDNYIYQNLTLAGEANDEQHQIAGIYGQIKSDCYPGIEEMNDAVTEELSSDASSQTSTYLVSFLRGYKDPSTAQFRVVARIESSYIHTPVYYRWNESFDFTFTVE